MSEADQMQAHVTAQGVEVSKALNLEDFSVPSLVFNIRGPPDAAAHISVCDPIPDAVGPSDVGFHPKHGGEYWTYDGESVTFTRRFDPGEKYTTVYGIVGLNDPTAEWLSAEPAVVRSDRPDGVDPGSDAPDGEEEAAVGGESEDLLMRLAAELEADGDAADQIRTALLVGNDSPAEELREPLEEVADRVDALESDLRERDRAGAPGSVDDRLESLREDVDEDARELESIGERVADLEAELNANATLGETADSLADRLDDLEARVNAVEERDDRDAPRERIEDVRETVEAEVADVRTGVRRNARDIDDVGAEVAELAATLESLPLADGSEQSSLDELEAEVDRLAQDLETVTEFQDRLSETLLQLDTG